ncbi:MAG: AAA family ATPase [Clostridium sp.]
MIGNKKLLLSDLTIDTSNIPFFISTKEITDFTKIISQKTAQNSIDLGLKLNKKEYNIFISGESGTGKTSYIINKIEDYAKKQESPLDWCYVYNFHEEASPIAISLSTGNAVKFKNNMNNLVKYLIKYVPAYFSSNNYEAEKNKLLKKYDELIIETTDRLYVAAHRLHFSIHESEDDGFVFTPLLHEEEMTSEYYNKLSKSEKRIINDNLSELRLISLDVIKDIKIIDRDVEDELNKLAIFTSNKIIEKALSPMIEEYKYNSSLISYMELLKIDLSKNIELFLEENLELAKKLERNFLKRYEVSIVSTNKPENGCPVVFEDCPDIFNLLGRIEYENTGTQLVTDFSLIKPGSIHKANGGYLIISAERLLSSPGSWQALKRCLKSENIYVTNSKNNFEIIPLISLTPEPIPLKIKVILIGSDMFYSSLLSYDIEFKRLFKIKAEFDSNVPNDLETTTEIIGYFTNYIKEKKFLHLDRSAIIELLRHGSRLAENKKYISSTISTLLDLIDLGDTFAREENLLIISKTHILLALSEINKMHSLYKKKTLDLYASKQYIANLQGGRVGEINGLSVSDFGDCIIGRQHRITSNTFIGRNGVINIERESNLSGDIHSKGILILSSFLENWLCQNQQLSFNANIVFEQLYCDIDGDSASCAELVCLISSLSDVPIKQSLAITGSINQRGEVQPIGGVNDKIEGYFHICSLFILNGDHGVVIPKSNVDNLVLNDEILQAVSENKFNIYVIETIEDALTLLLDETYVASLKTPILDDLKSKIISKLEHYNEILNNQFNTKRYP